MSSYGTSGNPAIDQVVLTSGVEATWTGPSGAVSKIIVGIQDNSSAFQVAFVATKSNSVNFMTIPAGGSVSFEGLYWTSPILYIYQASGGTLNAYVNYWR